MLPANFIIWKSDNSLFFFFLSLVDLFEIYIASSKDLLVSFFQVWYSTNICELGSYKHYISIFLEFQPVSLIIELFYRGKENLKRLLVSL